MNNMNSIFQQIFCAGSIVEAHDILNRWHAEMLKKFPYDLCIAQYKEDVENLRNWMEQITLAEQCGTIDITMEGFTNNTSIVRRNLQYAVEFLTNPPQKERLSIVWDEMPDLLTDEQLSKYFGWAIATIQSKRSRGELPKIEGMALTPKKKLMEMFEDLSVDVSSPKDLVVEKINTFKR
jgi:hypothetical protein